MGDTGASLFMLVCLTPEWVVLVLALAGKIALCSWARQSPLTVPLSTHLYKWVLAILMLGITL